MLGGDGDDLWTSVDSTKGVVEQFYFASPTELKQILLSINVP